MKLHPIMQWSRYGSVLKKVRNNAVVLDVGCGKKTLFMDRIKDRIQYGLGIDNRVENKTSANIQTFNVDFDNEDGFSIPGERAYDQVFMLAVIEHVNYPEIILKTICDHMKEDGEVFITTPARISKPILEFLSYKLKLISEEGVRDHKHYFSNKELEEILNQAGFKEIRHSYFFLRLNQLVIAKKK